MNDYCTNCIYLGKESIENKTRWTCKREWKLYKTLQMQTGNPLRLPKCIQNDWYKSKENKITTQEMIAVMQAHLDGKQIQWRPRKQEEWKDVIIPTWEWNEDNYRIKPEPKYRPWKNEEIPVTLLNGTGWTREKGTTGYNKINLLPIDTACLLQDSEWTPDANPYTTTKWYPCGVLEE